MEQAKKTEISLANPVGVTDVLRYLSKELGCDKWYVACHHQNLFVFRLTESSRDRYAVGVECDGPVERPVYQGSKAQAVWISPLHGGPNVSDEQANGLKLGLSHAG